MRAERIYPENNKRKKLSKGEGDKLEQVEARKKKLSSIHRKSRPFERRRIFEGKEAEEGGTANFNQGVCQGEKKNASCRKKKKNMLGEKGHPEKRRSSTQKVTQILSIVRGPRTMRTNYASWEPFE